MPGTSPILCPLLLLSRGHQGDAGESTHETCKWVFRSSVGPFMGVAEEGPAL